MRYDVNDRILEYLAEGPRKYGEHKLPLSGAEDLTVRTAWHKKGYVIDKLFDNTTYHSFITNIRNLIKKGIDSLGVPTPDHFELENYHHYVNNKDLHLKVIDKTKLLSIDQLPVPVKVIEARIGQICRTKLMAFNPFDSQRVYHLRIIRPQSDDNNPLHRDVWLPDYDNCINLYIPLAGSNELSSLILAPGSHLWWESSIERTESGAEINGVKFNVPGVTHIKNKHKFIRANPSLNEVLVFSPYLIHGGAVNLNPDKTRISLEMRLWRVK